MKTLSSRLVREKFVIYDPDIDTDDESAVIALSNRMEIELRNKAGDLVETLVVRAQNMHSCARLGARIVQSFKIGGSVLNRGTPFDWDVAWDAIVNDYEYAFNPARWVCIYAGGRIVYQKGEHHPLLDLIEKCDYENPDEYDFSVPMAEKAFQKTGKTVSIKYNANVALVVNIEGTRARCGVILRGPDRTTTFNFIAEEEKADHPLNIAQCLSAGAAFLEGIQLAFMTGTNVEKIRVGIIARLSKEEKQHREAKKRLSRLLAEIDNLESTFSVRYRPEKPDFQAIQADAEAIAQKTFAKKDKMPPRSKSAKNEQ